MSDNKRTRHKANREAALRVQAARETSGAGPSSTTASTRPQEASLQQKARFALVPIADAPKEKRQRGEPKLPYALRQNVVLEVANGQKYVQRRALPPSAIPGVSALDAFFKGKRPEEHGKATLPIDFMHVMSPGAALDGDSDDDFIIVTQKVPVQSRHHRRRVKQHSKWRDFVVPSLVHRYLAHKYGARVENDESDPGCRCGRQTSLSVTFVDWDDVRSQKLMVCLCTPAADQLLAKGFFPSAPIRPTFAFSLRLLEFISLHSLNVAPNVTAWADTLQQYWARRGLASEHGSTFRKRLGSALTWYQVLDNRAETTVSATLDCHSAASRKRSHESDADEGPARKRARAERESTPDEDSEAHDVGLDESTPAALDASDAATRRSRQPRVEDAEDEEEAAARPRRSARRAPARVPDGAAAQTADATRRSRRARVDDVEEGSDVEQSETQDATRRSRRARVDDVEESSDAEQSETQQESNVKAAAAAPQRPTDDLRAKCPLCFGGGRPELKHTGAHVVVCLDANFSQKRRKTAAQDEPLAYSGTRFATEAETTAMEAEVEEKRARPPRKRKRGTSAKLDDAVLDQCEESFIAAQEKVTKASKNYYSDTGLMALLCRHDRVLYVVNMTTPGERQHYALTLLRKLMLALPKDWNVGVLYDIACQLSRSIEKHGFLEEFAERFVFGVSVFHAYGHQWACQLVFHPRKREGFGLSDGEGCERFWSAIRCLIPGLRVSGFFRRLFVIDRQVDAMHANGMWGFGRWLFKRYNEATRRHVQAVARLDNGAIGAIGRDALAQEWRAQLVAQLAKLPRQSINAGDKVIESIMLALGRLDELRHELKDDRSKMKSVHKMTAGEASATMSRVDATEVEIKRTEAAIDDLRSSLGARASQKWDSLRGDAYLRARINARRLRMLIRSSIQSHKFEREKLERSYRRHVMQEKEHSQVKDLVHRREKNVASQVRRFNALVDQMTALVKQGKAPKRKMVLPRRLDSRQLFRLDVDDDIWQEDPGLGPQDEGDLPRWQTDENVKNGIVLLLEERRAIEELERLQAETVALGCWWEEERMRYRSFLDDVTAGPTFQGAVLHRADAHERMLVVWRRDLGKCSLAKALPGGGGGNDMTLEDKAKAARVDEGEASTDDDDHSSTYSTLSDVEDEPSAEIWDDMIAAGSDGEMDDVADARGITQTAETQDGADGLRAAELAAPATPKPAQDGDAAEESASESEPEHACADGASGATGHTAALNPEKQDSVAPTTSNPRKGYVMTRFRSGRFWCDAEDLARLESTSRWLSGRGLAVFAEDRLTSAQVQTVDVVHPEVLHFIQEREDALARGDAASAQSYKDSVHGHLELVLSPSKAAKWLILAHVPFPQHWTLVEVRWTTRSLHFYDSFSTAGGYAKEVERKTRALLAMCEEFYNTDVGSSSWNWVREQRRVRQRNGYDCGPFAAADLVSLLSSDVPSTKQQKDMHAWRQEMARDVRALERAEFVEKTPVSKDGPLIIISP